MRAHFTRSSIFVTMIIAGLLTTENVAAAGATCTSDAWTGTIQYTRTQTQSHSKTVDRVSGRGQDSSDFQMNYNYKALVAVVEDPAQEGSSIGNATVDHTMISRETSVARESNSCDQGKSWQTMTGTFTREQRTVGQGKDSANVTIGVNDDGTYVVGVSAPRIQGKTSGSDSASYSGQCSKKEGKNTTYPAMDASIDGGGLTSDGTHRVDPQNPTKLSGSYSQTNLNVTEAITWNLQKCGGELRITNLTFEHMKFPTWDAWQEISEQKGTIDGNLVRIRATVLNTSAARKNAEVSFKETYRGDKWDGARPDQPLRDPYKSVTLEPGEAKDVEMIWNSSGYAWFDDGRPRLVQRVKAEAWEKNKLADSMTKNLKVAPKPLVLVHGIWSYWKQFETWQNILTTSHSYDWKAFPVGEVTNKGIINTGRDPLSSAQTNTTAQNAEVLKQYIRYAQEERNAWHVDVVAHSVGGVIARQYIDRLMPPAYEDGRPQISHLIMLGTPNLGTPCADVMDFAFQMTGKSPNVIRELRQDTMAEFNRQVTNRNGVKFSALAGNPLPTSCKTLIWNDGFVPVPSAHWTIADRGESKSIHSDLTSTKNFSEFVKPRVAIGPRGNHGPEVPNLKSELLFDQDASFVRVSTAAAIASDAMKPDFAKAVKLAAKQSMEIDLPVSNAANFGVTFIAPREVSATLLDQQGVIVAKNLAGTPEANATFRSMFVDKAVNGGTWKLKLESTATRPVEALIATWKNAANPGAPRPVVAQR